MTECIYAMDGDSRLGLIVTVLSRKGYGGKITLSAGITDDGVLRGYKITDISETPGLGMKSTEEKFSSQFKNIPAALYFVTKTTPAQGQIEAISGATITSKAVTNAVDAAVAYAAMHMSAEAVLGSLTEVPLDEAEQIVEAVEDGLEEAADAAEGVLEEAVDAAEAAIEEAVEATEEAIEGIVEAVEGEVGDE